MQRLLGVMVLLSLLVPLLLVGVLATPGLADADEEEAEDAEPEAEELPSIDEVGSGTETSQEFRPEPYEQPSLFPPMVLPLAIGAGVVVLVLLGLYLLWQPRFAQEAREKRRR